MAGTGGSCLSDLSDDLLRHILFFAPAKEGAATAVLSRRWRWLWHTSGAVNLDSRSGSGTQTHEGFLRGAEKALAAAHGPIRKLTIFIAEDYRINLTHDEDWLEHSLMDAVVSNPAARRVEELQIDVHGQGLCTLSFGSLPSEALRVLRATHCSLTEAPPGASFPCLAELQLQGCTVVDLQTIVDAAPQLSTLHLASSSFSTEITIGRDEPERWHRLRCPSVTALVLADCTLGYGYWGKDRLELDVPRLRYLRYKGSIQLCNLFSLKSQAAAASDMIQVELHLTDDCRVYGRDQLPPRESFWKFVQNFKATKLLKLRLDRTMHYWTQGLAEGLGKGS